MQNGKHVHRSKTLKLVCFLNRGNIIILIKNYLNQEKHGTFHDFNQNAFIRICCYTFVKFIAIKIVAVFSLYVISKLKKKKTTYIWSFRISEIYIVTT